MGANHSLCSGLRLGIATTCSFVQLKVSLLIISTLQTNDCKALLQRLSNFLLLFHIFLSEPTRSHCGRARVVSVSFMYYTSQHPERWTAVWLRWRHTRLFTLWLFLLGREVEDVVGHENGFFEISFNFGGEKKKRKTNKSGPFPIVLLRKNSTRF